VKDVAIELVRARYRSYISVAIAERMPMPTAEFYAHRAEHMTKMAASLPADHPEKAEAERLAASLRSTASLMAERDLGPYPVTPDPNEAEGEPSR
jgi:hypothetical protein